MRLLLLLLTLTHRVTWSITQNDVQEGANRFSQTCQKFGRDVGGYDFAQTFFSELALQTDQLDGPNLVQQMNQFVSMRFQQKLNELLAIKSIVEEVFANASSDSQAVYECCGVQSSTVEYDPSFYTGVDRQHACVRSSTPVTSLVAADYKCVSVFNDLTEVEKNNLLEDPDLKWQYYGTEEGMFGIYPSQPQLDSEGHPSCNDYDPRFRPWYVAAAALPKDVVLVLDVSGSMRDYDRIGTMIEAATTVLQTLGPDDRVSVITFDQNVYSVQGQDPCFSTQLVPATPSNIDIFVDYVQSLVPRQNTVFSTAFSKAFDLIETTRNVTDTTKPTSIVFLTDGVSNELDYPNVISTRQSRGSMAVRPANIFLFVLGNELDNDSVTQARMNSIADNNGGAFVIVKDFSGRAVLRTAMGRYYSHPDFARATDEPILTVPYFDYGGLGEITTLAVTVFDRSVTPNVMIGVAGVDLVVSDLLSLFRNNLGASSYVFVIDSRRRTLLHPLLPVNTDVFLDISLLESDPSFVAVKQLMSTYPFGQTRATVRKSAPRGDVTDGVYVEYLSATYYWQTLNISIVEPYQLCLVLIDSDQAFPAQNLSSMPTFASNVHIEQELYHRIDLLVGKPEAPTGLCAAATGDTAWNTSVYMVPPSAWVNPTVYLRMNETAEDILAYRQEFFTNTMDLSRWGEAVYREIQVTKILEPFWQSTTIRNLSCSGSDCVSELSAQTMARYIGTPNVYRVFPGHRMKQNYDPTLRPWYSAALLYLEGYSVSPPYVDASGNGIVLTLSRPFFLGDPEVQTPTVYGVLGVDFSLNQFGNFLLQAMPQCKNSRCMIMDASGYLVWHETFCEHADDFATLNLWIGAHESGIANDLVGRKALQVSRCIDYAGAQFRYFYTVSDTLQSLTMNGYIISPIPNTSLYVIAVTGTPSGECNCNASESMMECPEEECPASGLPPPLSSLVDKCFCPCVCPVHFDACRGATSINTDPVCPVAPPALQPFPPTPAPVNKCPTVPTLECPRVASAASSAPSALSLGLGIGLGVGLVLAGILVGVCLRKVSLPCKDEPPPYPNGPPPPYVAGGAAGVPEEGRLQV
jgi:Mg-chelatase subunit ChlD